MRLNALAALPSGGFVVGTVGTSGNGGAAAYPATPADAPGGLFVYAGGALRAMTLPRGQYVVSLLALPGGGYAVGTATAGPCAGGARCPVVPGRLGVAPAGAASVRWYTPPLPGRKAPLVGAVANGDPAGGVIVGAAQGTRLWFGVNGVGVAALNTADGRFSLEHGSRGPHYFPAAYGAIQFFPGTTSATTVYYSVHRLPGTLDAGYWGPLYAASAAGGGSARRLLPAPLPSTAGGQPNYGCVQGGMGTPRGARLRRAPLGAMGRLPGL